jgi:RND family efflux transporter MFP subunit
MKTRLGKAVMAAILLGIGIGFSACGAEKKAATAAPEVIRDVAVLDVRLTPVPDVFEAVGTVRAAQSAQLAAQVMGNIIAVNVREGDLVKRGQVLAVIDDAQPRAGVERAQAMVSAADHEAAAAESEQTLAAATLKRYQDLFEKKAVSPQEFDEVKARFQAASARQEMARSGRAQAKAALAQAQTMLSFTRIQAPFDGVITEKRVEPGALAAPGMPLLVIEGSGRFRLEAAVDESNLRYVKAGETVAVRIDSLAAEQLQGKIAQIVPAADPASRSFIVKVELPAAAQLRSGVFGRAYFVRGKREALVIPNTAIVDRGQLRGVYVVGGDHMATLRYVTVGKPSGDRVEVLSGLQPGERLVAAPGAQDLSGKIVP